MISTPSLSAWVTVGRLVGDHLWQSTLFAAPVALLAAREVVVDACDIDFETGRSALDHCDQFGSVRFAGSEET